jgi:hypothetical protein
LYTKARDKMLSTGSFPKPETGRLDKDEGKLRKIREDMFSQVSGSSRVAKRTAPLLEGGVQARVVGLA